MGVFTRGSKLWISFRDVGGKWRKATTECGLDQREKAEAIYAKVVDEVRKAEAEMASAMRPQSLFDLPRIRKGNPSQWCIEESDSSPDERIRVVWYKGDGFRCNRHHRAGHHCAGACRLSSVAIVYPVGAEISSTAMHRSLRSFPDARMPSLEECERSGGWIYAVATVPEIDIRRLKVGFTERDIEQRIAAHRTTNPTAVLLGLWRVDDANLERIAHKATTGRIGTSEVFQTKDVAASIRAIDEALARFRLDAAA